MTFLYQAPAGTPSRWARREERLCPPPYSPPLGILSWRLGAFAEIAGPEIVRAEIGQFAFQAFDVQPQRPAMAEHQHRAAAGDFTRMKLDPEQIQRGFRRLQLDVARLARHHPVKAQRRDQAARGG